MNAAAWMERCIAHYRTLLAGTTPDLTHEVLRLLDLSEPTQFFAYESKRFDWQAIVAVHSLLAPDGLMESRLIEPWTATKAFEDALAHPLWGARLPERHDEFHVATNEPDPTLRSAGLRAFGYLESTFRLMALWQPLEKPEATGFFQAIRHPCLVLQHRGSLEALRPEYPVDQAFQSARQNLENRQQWRADPPSSAERPPDVRGAYIVPRIRVGKLADQSLHHLAQVKLILPGVPTHRTTFDGFRVLVTHNGFVALAGTNPKETLQRLNLLAAAMLELGYQCYVFREIDLAELHEPRDTSDFWGGRFSGSPRQNPGDRDQEAWGQRWLRTSEFEEILTRAAQISTRRYAIHLQNYLEAYTHLQGHEPDQSLLFGWAILERWLHDLWKHSADGVTKAPSFGIKLGYIHQHGRVDDALYGRLRAAKELRNRVMHGEGPSTSAEATEFLETVELAIAGKRLVQRQPPS